MAHAHAPRACWILAALLASVAAQNNAGPDGLDLITPASEVEALPGACNCTTTGISGVASVDSYLGCDNFMSASGDDTFYCYVVSPASCPVAQASPRFSGAGYRGCNPDVDAVVSGAPEVLTLWELITETPNLSLLATALETVNLTDALASSGPGGEGYTLFAPSNYAIATFLNATNTTLEHFLDSPKLLALLLGHVASGTYNQTAADEAGDNGGIPSLSPGLNTQIQASLEAGYTITGTDVIPFEALTLSNPVYGPSGVTQGTIATADVAAENGHLYIIGGVIALLADLTDSIEGEPQLSTFAQALNVSGVGQMLSEDCPDRDTAECKYSPLTVFAPTNTAFKKLAAALGVRVDDLLKLPELSDILLYHFTDPSVETTALSPDSLVNGTEITTLYDGQNISVVANTTTIPLAIDPLTGELVVTTAESIVLLGAGNDSSAAVSSQETLAAYNGVGILIDRVLLPFTLSSSVKQSNSSSPLPTLD